MVKVRAIDLRTSWLHSRITLVLLLTSNYTRRGRMAGVCVGRCTSGSGSGYILVSLEEAPPAIFWTRRVTSSFFSSSSCLPRSSLDLGHSCAALTPGCHEVNSQHFVLPLKSSPISQSNNRALFRSFAVAQWGGIVRTMASVVEGSVGEGFGVGRDLS